MIDPAAVSRDLARSAITVGFSSAGGGGGNGVEETDAYNDVKYGYYSLERRFNVYQMRKGSYL